MTIIEKIQEVMDWNGIEQKKLAELTGLSKSTISTYMRGVNKISIENLQKIADALGVSLWTSCCPRTTACTGTGWAAPPVRPRRPTFT